MKIEAAVKHLTPERVIKILDGPDTKGMLRYLYDEAKRHSMVDDYKAFETIRFDRPGAMAVCMEAAGEREDSGVVIKWIPYAVPFPNCNWCNEPAIGGVRQRRLDGIALETAYCESCVTQLSGVLTARKIPV